ncbi:RING-H2 finger protein ATL39 [Sorghum bicolor]|nr:RING-H2 finger protein ATL39 [Sorghum bicolor]|eukprot:XP_002437100.2 RING-H2 finger protein ATL39 [Sorghum bicolor]
MLCYCRRRRDRRGSESEHRVTGATASGGIDAAAAAIRSLPGVEMTLPAFSYAPQDVVEHGGGSALECAVCLGAVKEGEMVRQLPACMHVYHVGCIDRWLAAHQTCPVCRSIAA